MSRISSNSTVIRKKNKQFTEDNPTKTESTEIKRKNHLSDSLAQSCQDTPESIKSKISANSFVLPKNAAITMFEKINVC